MRPRTTARLYNTASRLWLTGAVLALLLPERTRLGIWLPLHMTLAGAVAVAISGAMQNFVLALTAAPAPPERLVWAQFALVNAGAASIAIGYPSRHGALVAVGGASFVCGFAVLAWIVYRARRRALNKRHSLPLSMYGFALACVLAGGTLGAFLGSGVIHDPESWIGLRHAHMTLNVLGFVSLTIAGTLVTLLPTVLRIRMPNWHGEATGLLLAGGVVAIAAGLGLRSAPVAAAGGLAYAGGSLGLAWMVVRTARSEKRWPVPVSAKHLVLGIAWFVSGTIALAVSLLRGVDSFDRFRETYLAMFVCGFIVQVLLGAWLYLLPMARPAHPDERRRFLAAIEFGGTLELFALNAGVALLVLHAAGWASGALASVGAGLALGGGGLALFKVWAFAAISRSKVMSERQLGVWGA